MIEQLLLGTVAAFGAAILSSVAGFGGATILLPVFVALFGPRDAIAVLTVSQLVSNGSRAWINRDQLHRPIVGWYALGAIPAAVVGGLLFAAAPLESLTRIIAIVLLLLVLWRRLKPTLLAPPLKGFALIGAVSGFTSALAGSTGPLTAPFFLAYGLQKRAYIGTEAAASLLMHLTKLIVYGTAAVLAPTAVLTGLALAPATAAGVWVGTRLLDRLPVALFLTLVEIGIVVAALILLLNP